MDYPKSDPSARLHQDKFTDGDPVNGILASRDSAGYQNMVFDELINAIKAGGEEPDEAKHNQLATIVSSLLNGRVEMSDFNALHAGNGYQKLPGGLIIQWASAGGTNDSVIVFPQAFPAACFKVFVTENDNTAISGAVSETKTGFTLKASTSTGFYYLAIGV